MVPLLEWGDYVALIGYFVLVIGFGVWVKFKKICFLFKFFFPIYLVILSKSRQHWWLLSCW